ncbi:MAG: sigma-70 family RNA polymerase sigma factor [Planctomycetota bacterium]|nr:MAG: sigma-70 family RNA polymerase sigma factor [Planctomycetota bacterium]
MGAPSLTASPVTQPHSPEVTQILAEVREGQAGASERLFPLVYDELRRLAAVYLQRERPDHTLQATALVHEAFLRLVDQDEQRWENRAHFFAVAARAMRRILIDHARGRHAAKRGGQAKKVPLSDFNSAGFGRDEYLLALDEALTQLNEMDGRQARIVELRFFGGLTIEETAKVLSISHATVERDWNVAKAWLHREITQGDEP